MSSGTVTAGSSVVNSAGAVEPGFVEHRRHVRFTRAVEYRGAHRNAADQVGGEVHDAVVVAGIQLLAVLGAIDVLELGVLGLALYASKLEEHVA